ncbi:hypothetical protein [Streptomyces sp. NPDC093225]|uniref:hypothetical protein n=1 Tax=Streptomyces sp. NPDC093225 TaxID=3366034 RepID=UPI0037F1B0F5
METLTAETPRSLWSDRTVVISTAFAAVQTALCCLVWMVGATISQDSYGDTGIGIGMLVGTVVFLPVAGALVLAGALVEAFLFAVPLVWLGQRLTRRWGASTLLWVLAVPAAAAFVLAGLLAAGGAPFRPAWALSTGWAVLPAVAAHWHTTHGLSGSGTASRVGAALAAAITPLMLLVATADASGLLAGPYHAPELGARGYVGTWSEGGIRLHLEEGGRAVLTEVPYDDMAVPKSCTGRGSWQLRPAETDGRESVELDVPACDGISSWPWDVGGTTARPELFMTLGDPDTGELHILHKG